MARSHVSKPSCIRMYRKQTITLQEIKILDILANLRIFLSEKWKVLFQMLAMIKEDFDF